MPSKKTYARSRVMAIEGQSLGQQPNVCSAEYVQRTVSNGSKSIPVHAWVPKTSIRDLETGSMILDGSKTNAYVPSLSDLSSSKVAADGKASGKLLDSEVHLPISSSNRSNRHIKPLNKLTSDIQEVGVAKEYHHSAKISSVPTQGQDDIFSRNSFPKFRSTCQTVNSNESFQVRETYNLQKHYEASSELVHGPRAERMKNSLSSSAEKDGLTPFICRKQFNKSDFQIKYEHAKFFMIKSYSEDDIHKSIKYNVWASTPNGNTKLDAAFQVAEKEKNEKGTKCPIFLFFSVNTSGQFVGLAEMIGPVDFKKNMDFWQQDKWNGFFPVKWHVIKDIPNRHFQNITLENNENKAVTFSRDTQEIRLPQGLRMLHIFKGYPLESSVLDDFDFYERREKSLCSIRSSQQALVHPKMDFHNDDSLIHLDAEFGKMSMSARPRSPRSSLKSRPSYVIRN